MKIKVGQRLTATADSIPTIIKKTRADTELQSSIAARAPRGFCATSTDEGTLPAPHVRSVPMSAFRILTSPSRWVRRASQAMYTQSSSNSAWAMHTAIVNTEFERRSDCKPRTSAWIGTEISLTWRLLIHNASVNFVPPACLTVAACVCYGKSAIETIQYLSIGILVNFLFSYAFDASNQTLASLEDLHNKPVRPIPSGLVSPRGLMARFIIATCLYILSGWYFGILPWVLLWVGDILIMNLFLAPSLYRWYKSPAMIIGGVALLGSGWGLVAPVNALAWKWILIAVVLHAMPLNFEDLRDIEGDARVGRDTWVSRLGHWPIRIWSAGWLFIIPFMHHFFLYLPANPGLARLLCCDVLLFGSCWYIAVRMLIRRTSKADALTYQLFWGSWVLCLSAFSVLYS